MSTTQLIFNISKLIEQPTGTRDLYSFEFPLIFEDIKTRSNVSGQVEIMRIDEGLNVAISKIDLKIEDNCKRCLKKFTQKIQVPKAERQYLFEKPHVIEDIHDLYLIDKKKMTINLAEFLRQEIILHFPSIPVCSKSCKGICSLCGKNRNKQLCKCQVEETGETNKPLAVLKDLFK